MVVDGGGGACDGVGGAAVGSTAAARSGPSWVHGGLLRSTIPISVWCEGVCKILFPLISSSS